MPDSVSIPDWAASIDPGKFTPEEIAEFAAQVKWSMYLDGRFLNEGENNGE